MSGRALVIYRFLRAACPAIRQGRLACGAVGSRLLRNACPAPTTWLSAGSVQTRSFGESRRILLEAVAAGGIRHAAVAVSCAASRGCIGRRFSHTAGLVLGAAGSFAAVVALGLRLWRATSCRARARRLRRCVSGELFVGARWIPARAATLRPALIFTYRSERDPPRPSWVSCVAYARWQMPA